MAPEAWGGAVTPAMDVYSLSVSLFELVAGEPPFAGENSEQLRKRSAQGLSAPEPRLNSVPQEVEELIREGLNMIPEMRPTLGDFGAGLRGSLNRLLADSIAECSLDRREDSLGSQSSYTVRSKAAFDRLKQNEFATLP